MSSPKKRRASWVARPSPAPPPPPPAAKTPTTVAEYHSWARATFGIEHDDALRRWYELNAGAAQNAAQVHPFFSELGADLEAAEIEYRSRAKVELLMDRQLLLRPKPYESMVDKSLRRNVLENPKFPDRPPGGWFVPETWFALNNDIVRTYIVCKYMDGPQYLAERFTERAKRLHLDTRMKSQQNDDGYYAYHFYVRIPFELTDQKWAVAPATLEVEIQVTTQLQEVLRALTHRLYEVRRLDGVRDRHAWKWQRNAARFRAAYLGHTLHMLEASILDLRDAGGKP